MTIRRAVITGANPLASDEPYSDTRLLATGPASYLLATGPVTVMFDQHDRKDRSSSQRTDLALGQGFAAITFFGRLGQAAYEHAGVAPTIARLTSFSVTEPITRSGSIRLWIAATQDLKNGVWAEVENDTSDLYGPAVLPITGYSQTVSPTSTAIVENDPGYEGVFNSYPSLWRDVIGGVGYHLHLPFKLSFGYTIDGEDTVCGTHYTNTTGSPDWGLELGFNPAGYDYGDRLNEQDATAYVLFSDGSGGVRNLTLQNTFLFDPAAIATPEGPLVTKRIVVEKKYSPLTMPVLSAFDSFADVQSAALPIDAIQQVTAVNSGFTLCAPPESGNPTGIVFARPGGNSQFYSSSQFAANGYFPYAGRSDQFSADLFLSSSSSCKDGPRWHEQNLALFGTAAGQPGARNDIELTFPEYPPPQKLQNFSTSIFDLTSRTFTHGFGPSEFLAIVSLKTVTLRSSAGERLLMPTQYMLHEVFPQFVVEDTTQAGQPYRYTIDLVLTFGARSQMVEGSSVYQKWTESFPFSSLGQALAAGVSEDAYWYLQQPVAPRYERFNWQSSRLQISYRAAAKLTYTKIDNVDCEVVRYRQLGLNASFTVDVSRSNLQALGNEEAVPAVFSIAGQSPATGQIRLVVL